ncbi:AraC family transcriptional regulator [Escherichia coli]|nr:AraC family transcriptional regulator [Escherichia coli]
MSPLRYQKWLRLNEVRRPMLNEHYDVTTAAYAVGDVVCCGKRSRG